jgi:hypothetical protein
MNEVEYKFIEGSGGKGGGGGGQEAPNTLQNNTLVQLLHLLSEGPIQGLATGDGQSIYLNKVPLQGANGVFNFTGATYTLETGTANQSYIPGFANVTSVYSVDLEVYEAFPEIYTVSSNAIDAVMVTLGLPNGLREIDSSGNIDGYEVGVKIETKPHSSNTWTCPYNVIKNDKTDGNYQWQVYCTRPTGAANATWDIRVTRTTPDDSTSNTISTLYFVNAVEVQEIQESYDTFAVCGMSLNAQQFGTNIPSIAFLLKGVTVNIPDNYNPTTRTYTGNWDGGFTTGFTNNPAWILYDLLTNTQYGGGVYGVTEDVIDKFSFYNAGVFCDVQVPSGVANTTEPRFTFDAPIQQRGDFFATALQIAGMMNSNLIWANGLLTLNQDRPANSVTLVTKTNVLMPGFEYVGTPLGQRITAVNVTYADKNNYYYPKISVSQNSAASNIYGYNCDDIAAFGATSEGQAIRAGKWYIYTSLMQTDTVNFKMGLNGNILQVGDVFDLYDEDYTSQAGSGRILSANTNTVWLDQSVTISGNTPMIGILLNDGITYSYYNIASPTSGNSNTVTISNTFSQIPSQLNDYLIISAVAPRTFRVTDMKQGTDPQELDITAVLYNNGNYSFIEEGINLPTTPYSTLTFQAVGDPQSIQVTEMASNIQQGEAIRRGLLISWQPPSTNNAVTYTLDYRFNNGTYKVIDNIKTNAYDLENLAPGEYDFILHAVSVTGVNSPGANFSYTIAVSGGSSSLLFAPTNFTVNGSGNSFVGQDIGMEWLNPPGNQNLPNTGVLKDFQLDIMDPTFSTILNTYTVASVPANTDQYFLYTYADNNNDYGSPQRLVYATIYARDTAYNLSNGTSTIFTNPAPPSISGTVTALSNAAFIQLTLPTVADFEGILVWRSTSSGFTPSNSSLIFNGLVNQFADNNLTPGTTYYYKWAAYDSFTSPSQYGAGTGLNISSQTAVTPVVFGIPQGASLPGTGTEGELFFDTTDGQLYRYHSGAWTLAVPAVNITGQITTTQISNNSITTPLLTANCVTAPQIAANSVTSNAIIANAITAGKIAAAAISTGTIQAGAVTATQIASGTITTTQLAVLSSGAGTEIDMANGFITFDNGTYMKVTGVGFGNTSQFLEWYGPHGSSASNFAFCTEANAKYYLKVNGETYFGQKYSSANTTNGYRIDPPDASGVSYYDQWGYFVQPASSPATVPFNINFPNACVNVVIANALGSQTYFIDNITTSGFQLNFGASYDAIYWRAFGY